MTWVTHQRQGFFGFDATGEGAPQLLHKSKVDINEALEKTHDIRAAWLRAQKHPNAPAYSGGVLDSWPQRMVDGFAICNAQMRLVDLYRQSLKAPGG